MRMAAVGRRSPALDTHEPFNWNNGGIDRIALSELAPGE
jgi:hypothetical protein